MAVCVVEEDRLLERVDEVADLLAHLVQRHVGFTLTAGREARRA